MAKDTTTTEEKITETTAAEAPAAPETTTATAEAVKPAAAPAKRRKNKRSVATGQVHVLATFNNTIITFTDPNGGALTASSSGACGFRGSKKGTAYAAQVATERAGNAAKQQYGFGRAEVFVKGVGLGRDAAVRTLSSLDIQVESITDVTGVPHGGVRPKKARRV